MQQIVMPFDGKQIDTIKDERGTLWVSVRSVCNAIGVDSNSQIDKLRVDHKFNRGDITSVAEDGKQRSLFCIPLNQLNGWLFSINANKVHPSIKDTLLKYQQECFNVLYKHFIPRGEQDLSKFMERFDRLETKLDNLTGVQETVFGDDAVEIQQLIELASKKFNMSQKEYWGRVRKECDVSSYKQQNRKIKNFIKNDLGIGIKLAKEPVDENKTC